MTEISESRVFVNDIRLHAYHGVMEQERLTGNDYLVNLSAGIDLSAAIASDDVRDTLNYAELYRIVSEEMARPSRLVEHVAGRIARRVLAEHGEATDVWIKIVKQNPPMGAACAGAGVEMRMHRKH